MHLFSPSPIYVQKMQPSASSDRTIYFIAHIVEYTQNKSLPFRSTPRHITSTITAMETISNSLQHLQIQKLSFSLIAINPTRSNLKSHPHCHIRYVLYPLIFDSHKMPFLSFFLTFAPIQNNSCFPLSSTMHNSAHHTFSLCITK